MAWTTKACITMTDEQNDIVTELREQEYLAWAKGWDQSQTRKVIREAADEIERLRKELADEYMHGYRVGVDDGFNQ